MLSRTIPLLTRSLRVDARLLRSHLFRLLFVLYICVNLFSAHLSELMYGAPGLQFFKTMAYLNLMYISLAGISFFATGITEEKEEDTLGLLKMAGIGSLVILLGKSVSRLVSASFLLAIQIPFTLLAVTLGGVTQWQIFSAFCSLAAFLVLMATMGLFCSVVAKRSRLACGMMVVFLIAFFLGSLIGEQLCLVWIRVEMPNPPPKLASFGVKAFTRIWEATPIHQVQKILNTGFNESIFSFQFISNLVAAPIFFGLAWLLFEPCTRNLAASTTPGRNLIPGRTSRWWGLRGDRVWRNAVAWKDFYFIVGGKTLIIVKFVLYTLASYGIYLLFNLNPQYFKWEHQGIAMMIGATVLCMIELSLYASRLFYEEVKWKTLSTLIMLPIPTWRLVLSKIAGCAISLVPVTVGFVIGAIMAPDGLPKFFNEMTRGDSTGLFVFAGMVLYFFVFLHLTALLSLFVKWGALPLAFIIALVSMVFYQTMIGIVGFVMRSSVGPDFFRMVLVLTDFALLALILVLGKLIVSRLKTAATQS